MSGRTIYFLRPIGMDGPVKIGVALDLASRFAGIQACSPLLLEVAASAPGDHRLERKLHQRFIASHSHAEWFHASADLTRTIQDIRAGRPLAEVVEGIEKAPEIWRKDKPATKGNPGYPRYVACFGDFRRAKSSLKGNGPSWHAPRRAASIFKAWRDSGYQAPPEADLAYLAACIADPAAHFVSYFDRMGERSGAVSA